MKTLSLTAFKNLCNTINPDRYIYNTDNQMNGFNECSKVVTVYTEVITMLNPNRICFKNEFGTLCINRVKCIKQLDSTVGYVFAIISGDYNSDENNKTYVMVADKK